MPEVTVVPILYATIAAAFFGGQVILTMRALAYMDPLTCSMISMGVCVFFFWLLAPFLMRAEYWLSPGIWFFLANGLISPLFSMYLSFEATKRMGATVSATICATTPLFTAAGAVLVLEEHLTLALLLGTLGTVVGIMVLSWERQGPTTWALSALLFPIGAAVIRGGSYIVVKFGLVMLPSPYFGSLISFTVSFAGTVLIYRYRQGVLPMKLPWPGLKWNVLAGVGIAIAILFMYSAINSGLVVVVSPIISAFPLFTFLISMLFRQEILSKRMLLGVMLVVGGIAWISLQ